MLLREDKNSSILNSIKGIEATFGDNCLESNIEVLKNKIVSLTGSIDTLKNRGKLKQQLIDHKILLAEFKENEEKLEIKNRLKTSIEEKEKYLSEVVNYSPTRYADITFALRKLDEDEKEFKNSSEELEKLLQLKEILHVNGLPKILIQSELIKLENMINDNINKYFTTDIKLSFDYTDKKLEINIKTKHSPSNSYESLSGAEKSIVKIASSLAFQRDDMSIVRLDEIDAFFDESNRLSFSSFLENLSRYTDQVFCISHNTELLDNNNFNTINLSKE
jgi:chromosome segregation ATPase